MLRQCITDEPEVLAEEYRKIWEVQFEEGKICRLLL